MVCARQKRIKLFVQADYIQIQYKDTNRPKFEWGDVNWAMRLQRMRWIHLNCVFRTS